MSSTLLEPTVASVLPVEPCGPRGLLFFLSHQDTYRRPLFSGREVFCGPDTDARGQDGRVAALKAPAGSFDVTEILRQLPSEQSPEFVVVKADATGRNFPRNLRALSCPKVLLVGDTHHLAQPLQRVISYAKSEPFDFIVFDHTRHHAHFFAEAGLRNLHWLPAVDYGYVARDLAAHPWRTLTFVGQTGRHHPWRRAVLDHVKAAGLPLETLRGTLEETADIYANSQVTLNVSLNGDLNLRVFEALAAGGFLLTDELSEASGLRLLFEPGKHLETWRTPGELVEKIRHYLANPAAAAAIRREGQAEIRRAHHPEVKIREFFDLVFSGKVNPRYDLALDRRFSSASAEPLCAPAEGDARQGRLDAYEHLQALHRVAREVVVFCPHPETLSALADLPRLRFAPLEELGTAPTAADAIAPVVHVLWADLPAAGLVEQFARFTGSHLVVPEADAALARELAAWGFVPVANGSWVHELAAPVQFLERAIERGWNDAVRPRLAGLIAGCHDATECVTLANFADTIGENALRRTALEQAIALDRSHLGGLLALAGVLFEQEDRGSTLLLLEEAARIAKLPDIVEELRLWLAAELAEEEFAKNYNTLLGRRGFESTRSPRKILLVTNLFPPQELGGYGRMMWEFAHGLRARGHEVRVLAGNSPMLAKKPTPDEVEMEKFVSRRLELLGVWYDGRPSRIKQQKEIDARTRANSRLIRNTARAMGADVVLAGNLDFIGSGPINAALESGLPVLHAVANVEPGYKLEEQPTSERYWVAPCSHWNGDALRAQGYLPARVETLHPGARFDRFYRLLVPDTRRLRICYASLVLPYKGAHTLVEALAHLQLRGVDFTAEIAGDAPDRDFLAKLEDYARNVGIAGRLRFTGFMDRPGLISLFARSNVLVFPSTFEEPFGISQVEAMASGLVVVSSGTGGAKEIVTHGVDGLRFESNNATDLADKLQTLAADRNLFAELQQTAPARAKELSVDAAVRRIEELIDGLVPATV